MILRAAALLSLLLAFASPPVSAAQPVHHRVRVGAFRVERDITPGRNKVVGSLTNISRAPIHTARIRFRLFDAKGHVVGQAMDEVHDLPAGKSWKFHALARGNVSRARLVSVETK